MTAELEHAAEVLAQLLPHSTPGPWRDSTVDGNRYRALVSDTCTRGCDGWRERHPGSTYDLPHPHEGYGGCLVGESHHTADLQLMAVMRNVADHLPGLLLALAHEDPIQAGHAAHALAGALVRTTLPTGATS